MKWTKFDSGNQPDLRPKDMCLNNLIWKTHGTFDVFGTTPSLDIGGDSLSIQNWRTIVWIERFLN